MLTTPLGRSKGPLAGSSQREAECETEDLAVTKWALLAFALALATSGEAAADQTQDAINAYVANDFAAELKLARLGNPSAQDHLSAMYQDGRGTAHDPVQALFWLRKAAESGSTDAQDALGGQYERGDGLPQNYALAVRWYRRAAEQKDFLGCVKLGEMYTHGTGVEQDYVQALHWYGIAAEGANAALPRQRFGEICLLTACNTETVIRAYEFLAINADRTLFYDKENSSNLLKQLAQKMRTDQIDQGRDLANVWEGRNPEPKLPL